MYRLSHCGETYRDRGFELFVKAGLQVDDLVDWPWKFDFSCYQMDSFYTRWQWENREQYWLWKNKKRYWPTILDYLFYFHRPLFDKFAHRSAALASYLTRAGVLISMEGGKDKFNEYLSTRTSTIDGTWLRRFLELMLAEQFAMRDMECYARRLDIDAARQLLCLGSAIGVSIDKNLASSLIDEVLLRAPQCGREVVIEALNLLDGAGAVVGIDTLKKAVDVGDNDLLELLAGRATQDLQVAGATALANALSRHNLEAAEILIRYGVDINAEIPIYDVMGYSVGKRASVLAQAVSIYSPRALSATEESQLDMVRFMVHRGAHLQLSAHQPHPFHLLEFWLRSWISYVSPLRVIQYTFNGSSIPGYLLDGHDSSASLLDACAHLSKVDGFETVGRQVFEYLFRQGADVRHGNPLGVWIYMGGGEELVLEMLAAGADINAVHSRKTHLHDLKNALHNAAARCDPGMVSLLIENGANVNEPARGIERGHTALQAACYAHQFSLHLPNLRKQLDTIRILLENGSEVNAPPIHCGGTALGEAAAAGKLEVAMLLLAHGADVNAPVGRFARPENALDEAARHGRMDMVKLLLNANALSGDRGDTGYDGAIRLAEIYEHLAIADMIRQHMLDDEERGISNPCLEDPPRTWHEHIPAWEAIGEWPCPSDIVSEHSSSASCDEDSSVGSENESMEDSHQGEAPFGDTTPEQPIAHEWVSSIRAGTTADREHLGGEVPHQIYDVEPVTFAQASGLYNHLGMNMDLDGDEFSGQTAFGGPDLDIVRWDDGIEANAPSWQPQREWWQDTEDRVVEVEED